jgi:hypothetical protein
MVNKKTEEKQKKQPNDKALVVIWSILVTIYSITWLFLITVSFKFIKFVINVPEIEFTNKFMFLATGIIILLGYLVFKIFPSCITVLIENLVKNYKRLK